MFCFFFLMWVMNTEEHAQWKLPCSLLFQFWPTHFAGGGVPCLLHMGSTSEYFRLYVVTASTCTRQVGGAAITTWVDAGLKLSKGFCLCDFCLTVINRVGNLSGCSKNEGQICPCCNMQNFYGAAVSWVWCALFCTCKSSSSEVSNIQ